MKFYGGLAVAIVVFVLLLLYLQDHDSNPPARIPAASTPNQALSTAQPASSYSQSNNVAASATRAPVNVATVNPYQQQAARPASPYKAPAPAPAAQPRISSGCSILAGAAQRAHATVASCGDQAGWTVITVWGYDRNNLNDFLDEAMKSGIRDVAPAQKYRQSVVGGRPIFQNTFKFRF
jgi:hypothetical protein